MPNENVTTEEDLIEKTEARLAAIDFDGTQTETDDSTSDTDVEDNQTDDSDSISDETNETDSDAEEVTDGTQTETDDSTSDTGVEDNQTDDSDSISDETNETDSDAEEVKLPDNYYRAAIHQGWKEKDIADFFEANPELAKRTFAKIYESTNKISASFAQRGQAQLQKNVATTKEVVAEKVEPVKIDVEKLRENYGSDEPLVDVIKGLQEQNALLQEQNKQQFEQQENLKQNQQDNSQESQLVFQQIDNFFTQDNLKLYGDFYGPGKDAKGNVVQPESLTPGNKANRHAVLELADQIIAGSALQGSELSVPDALELAHLSVTSPIKEQKIREGIIKNVKKRSKSITLKDSGKPKADAKADSSKGLPEKQLEKKVSGLLAKVFSKK